MGERSDLLAANALIFKAQGGALDKVAKKSVKVLVVGNPANTNALIASHYAPSIPKKNFTALTRLDLNRADSQIADKTGVAVEDIKDIIIWGNHSATQYPDVNHATIGGKPLREVVNDNEYLNGPYITKVLRLSLLAVSPQLRPQPTLLATMCMTGGTEPQESAPPWELSPTETIMVPPKESSTVSLALSTTLVNGRSLTGSRSTRCPAREWTPLEKNWLMSAKWPSESELIYFQP